MKGVVAKILTCLISFHLVCAPVAQAKSGNAKANILMIATAIAAPLVMIQCSGKISSWIFMGTAGYFLAMELFGSKEHKDDSKNILEEYKGKGASEKQIEALEAAADSADRAAKSGDDRSKRFKLAALGFGAAAAAALVEAYLTPPGSCVVGAAAAGAAAVGVPAAGVAAVGVPAAGTAAVGVPAAGATAASSGAMGWGGISSFFSKAWIWLQTIIDNGYIRAAIFGALAALAFMASADTKKDADQLRKQAKHYRDLAAKMRRRLGLEKGLTEGKTQYIPPISKDSGFSDRGESVAFGEARGPCVVGAPGQYLREDPTCACKKTNTCKKAELPKVDYPQFAGVSGDLNEVGVMLKKDADKVYSGDLSGAGDLSDATLTKMAAKLDNVKRKLWGLSEKRLKSQGKKMSGALLEQAYGNRLKRAINSDFKKMSAANKSRLAAISPALVSGVSPSKKSAGSSIAAPAKGNNAVSEGGGTLRSGQKRLGGIEFLDSDQEEPAEAEDSGEQDAGDSEKDIEDKAIHDNEEQSIWRLLSNRYLKSFF